MSSAGATVRASSARGYRLPDLWRYRGMMWSLVVRDLKVKYQRSLFGFLWTLLNPLLTVGLLVVVFQHIVRIPVPDYWAFLISGYFVWNFLTQSLSSGAYIIASHGALRRSVAFPSEVLVISAVVSRLVEFLLEMSLALLAITVFHHHGAPASLLLLPVLVVIQLVMTVGLLMPIAAASVFYTDVQHALPIALLSLFYISPVFYPATMVPEAVRQLYFVNPVAGLMTLFHTVLYEGRVPSFPLLAGTAAAACALFVVGYVIFKRYSPTFAELV